MGRVIGIVSAKGGVGKTVVTLNLASALMEFKKDVIAVDADLKTSGLGLQLGMYHFPVTLNDVLTKEMNILEALYIHPSGLRVIPASLYAQEINVSRLSEVLNNSFLESNIVLVDAPPGLEKNALAVLKACKEIVIVTLPEIPSVVDVMKTITYAEKFGTKPIGIIVNRYKEHDKEQVSPKEIEASCNLPVIGTVPEDKTLGKSIFRRVPAVFLDPFSPASMAFKEIASQLIGESYKPPKFPFFRRLFRKGKK
jgi:septum site-determining protein MinD